MLKQAQRAFTPKEMNFHIWYINRLNVDMA